MSINNTVAEFEQAMQAIGLMLDKRGVIDDGKVHTCRCAHDSAGKKSGRYYLHSDGVPNGAFGCYHESENALTHKWQSEHTPALTDEERKAYALKMKEAEAERAKQIADDQAKAKTTIQEIWGKAKDASTDNAYCQRKGIKPMGCKVFADKDTLIIPVFDSKPSPESLCNAQFVMPDGTKRFKTGGKKKGCYCAIGKTDSKTAVICEGFATGASIAEATGYYVLIAFDAGNLLPVAERIKERLPTDWRLIIAADNDAYKDDNVGVRKATECAQSVGAQLVIPDFTGCDISGNPTDFNDLHQLKGLETVKAQIDSGTNQVVIKAEKMPVRSVNLLCAANVKPEPIFWAWRDWLPLGKFTLLAGAGGTGKTTLSIALAAAITKGSRMPDKSPCGEEGNVLIWSGEDDPSDTLVPRFMAAGADLNKVHIINGAKNHHTNEIVSFDPAKDVPLLEKAIADIGGAVLLIIDPVIQAVTGDSHKSNDVRRALQAIVDLSARNNLAVIGITHFSKGGSGKSPTERVIGSEAFTSLARMVLVTSKSEDGKRVLARTKANIANDSGGFEYDIETLEIETGIFTSRVVWGDHIEGSAREILSDVESHDTDTKEEDEYEKFLIDLLGKDAVLVDDIRKQCTGAGVSFYGVRRKSQAMGIQKKKLPQFGGAWTWELPDDLKPVGDPLHVPDISSSEHHTLNPAHYAQYVHYDEARINSDFQSLHSEQKPHSEHSEHSEHVWGDLDQKADILPKPVNQPDKKLINGLPDDLEFGAFINDFTGEVTKQKKVNLAGVDNEPK